MSEIMDRTSGACDGSSLPVVELFYSVQGEGTNAGTAAFFIRFAGCNVHCDWCDAKNTWAVREDSFMKVEDIVAAVADAGASVAVVTGGEPLLNNLDRLCVELHRRGIRIFLETSGTLPVSGSFDWICVSPKRKLKPLESVLALADEIKVVVSDASDFSWAEMNSLYVKPDCRLLLQPQWERMNDVMPAIIDYVKKHTAWHISLQTHKFMQIP